MVKKYTVMFYYQDTLMSLLRKNQMKCFCDTYGLYKLNKAPTYYKNYQ